ncbi:TAXI family TRAP transporter solute-binding subunit [Halomonas piscis]|uniref:TAXI family TRAP transporter solute-binding subunit n=1 Tax=Halomonas piscis TaxID=3031727 RepID=A0ABY9Z174_9GAMM|nr:TAXI family TRAP transporter solute-binding subunit [Halomonas piscis]WNK20029.1 TAXI family TRAP transporter solute-binding subunit [Halomonas piscis]
MRKRIWVQAAALGLSGALLAGCGDDADVEEPSQTGDAGAQQSTGDAGAKSAEVETPEAADDRAGDAPAASDAADEAQEEKDKADADMGEKGGDEAGDEAASGEPVSLIFGTGGTGGTYYPIGGALKGVFEQGDLVENVQVVSTGASVQNINNISDGLNHIAIVMSDVAYDAVNGDNQFDGEPAEISALAGLYPNVVQIVATADSDVESVADLEGKRVGVGKVGSGVEQSATKVIESAGMSYDDLAKVSHTGYADSVTAMSNGNLDAAFFTSGVPNSSITGLQQNTDIVFVPVEGEVADKLLEAYPYYETYTVPAGAPERYDLDEEVDTVAIRNMLIVGSDMRDDVAEELTRRFYDYLNSDKVSVGALKQFEPNTMNENLVAPVHPGAESVYESLSGSADEDADSGDADGRSAADEQTNDAKAAEESADSQSS